MSRKVALIVGGITTLAAGVAGIFMAKRTATAMKDAVSGAAPPVPNGASNTISSHLTGYWPFQEGLSAVERRMEGAPVDRKGAPLHTVEDFFAGKADHVSVSGDFNIFPYGQKVLIPWGDRVVVGRVTDTGGHFHGLGKVFRVFGAEPLDLCVATSATVIPKKTVDVQVVVGDHMDKPTKQLALAKAGKPTSVGYCGLDYLGVEAA